MLTDEGIQDLIDHPKRITARTPASGYREDGNYRRCGLELEATSGDDARFTIFIRQHNRFIENFSIGLRYRTGTRRWEALRRFATTAHMEILAVIPMDTTPRLTYTALLRKR